MPRRGIARFINVPDLSHWQADLRGGIQAAAVALPMGLAFGVVSGFGPVAGVYSAVCTGVFAALFGGTATQISGPTGPIAIVMASVVTAFADQPAAVAGVILLAGALQIAFGALRFGRYISLIPYPVMSGFATAVGCIIIVMQLNPAIGYSPVGDIVSAVAALLERVSDANPTTLLITLAALGACHYMPTRIRVIVPAHLAVLVAGTVAVALLGLDVPRLAEPESLLPRFEWPPLLALPWSQIWISALILALISSLDSLLTSVAADSATNEFHDSNRELVGQGLGNVAASLIGALPGAGSTFRTMANIRAGGRTPLSAVVHAAALAVLLLGLGGLIRFIPASVLAGILIYIGLGIIDWRYIRRLPFVPPGGAMIMLTVWLVALYVNVVTGAAVGIVLASLVFVKRMADLQLESVGISADEQMKSSLTEREREILDSAEGRILLINLGGPLAFGAANGLSKRLANTARYRAIVLDFRDVPHIDESGIIALENIIRTAYRNDQAVIISGLTPAVVRPILRFGLSPMLRSCARYRRRVNALKAAARISQADDAA